MNFVDFLFERINDRQAPFILGKEPIDYGRLLDDVSKLAHGLTKEIGRGGEVVLLSDNSYSFIVFYLATIKSGNVVMLMDPRIGEEQVRKIFEKKDPTACFIQKKFRNEYSFPRVWSEDDLRRLMADSGPTHQTHLDDLAAVVFTSGSTGAKKGVMITHGNLISNTSSIVEYLGLSGHDRVLVTLPFHYCYGASLLHTHIRVGGSIVLFDANFLGAVPDYIDRYSCTGFSGVPSTYQILLARSKFLEREMPTLKYMTQAGGKLETIYIKRIIDAFPSKRFFVMYGATEATARMSYLPPELLSTKLGSIGKGIPNITLKVVKEDGREVKPGEVGKIVASGPNIMAGYYGDEEGTAMVLKDGYYYTGDLATVDDEGYIFVVGRCRDIIKSAGYRISPYEIENLICEIDGVAACAVMGIPDNIMGEAVFAVVQHDAGRDETLLRESIIAECRRKLPTYKMPKKVMFNDRLPMNSSNKVDKNVLRKQLIEGEESR